MSTGSFGAKEERARGARRGWSASVALLGLALWAQLALAGLTLESEAGARIWAVAAYLAPLAGLSIAVRRQERPWALALALSCWAPALIATPEAERAAALSGWSGIAALATAIALGVVFASPAGAPERAGRLGRELLGARSSWWIGAALIALFVIPGHAIWLDERVARDLAASYADGPYVARAFLSIIHLAIWCVAAWALVLTPTLRIRYDARRAGRRIESQRRRVSARVRWVRAIAACALALGALATWAALR